MLLCLQATREKLAAAEATVTETTAKAAAERAEAKTLLEVGIFISKIIFTLKITFSLRIITLSLRLTVVIIATQVEKRTFDLQREMLGNQISNLAFLQVRRFTSCSRLSVCLRTFSSYTCVHICASHVCMFALACMR